MNVVFSASTMLSFTEDAATVANSNDVRVRFDVRIPSQAGDNGVRPDVFIAGNIKPPGRWRPFGLKLEQGVDDILQLARQGPSLVLNGNTRRKKGSRSCLQS